MILVTGATGQIGRPLVEQLAADGGPPVRVLVRDAARVDGVVSGVEVVEGDLARPESLDAALAGVERAFLLSPGEPDQVRLQSNFVQAAGRAGVRHVVKLSALGAGPDAPSVLTRWHGETEAELRESGIAWTFLRPHTFMQNVLGSAPSIAAQSVIYAPMGDARVSMVDARDIAAVAARCLSGAGHEGRSYDITGPEGLSYADVAERLSAALDKVVTYVSVPESEAREAMRGAGMPSWQVDALLELFASYLEHDLSFTTSAIAEVGQRAPRTFDEFARDHRQAFLEG